MPMVGDEGRAVAVNRGDIEPTMIAMAGGMSAPAEPMKAGTGVPSMWRYPVSNAAKPSHFNDQLFSISPVPDVILRSDSAGALVTEVSGTRRARLPASPWTPAYLPVAASTMKTTFVDLFFWRQA
jgi:hypothetical protein